MSVATGSVHRHYCFTTGMELFKHTRSSKPHLGDGPECLKAVQVLTAGPGAPLEGGGAMLLTTHHH